MPNPVNAPFGTAAPFRNYDYFLGGQILIIPAGTANANALITHTLRRLPRAYVVLDVGTQALTTFPFPRGSTAWSFSQISLALPTLTAAVTGLLI